MLLLARLGLPHFVFKTPHSGPDYNYSLKLDFWAHLKDDAYGIHVLHPAGNALQGAEGLSRTIDVTFEETEKIFGFIPIFPFIFDGVASLGFDTQRGVRAFLQLLLGFLIVLGFLISLVIYGKDRSPKLVDVT